MLIPINKKKIPNTAQTERVLLKGCFQKSCI